MVRILALENGQKFKASLVIVLMRLCPSGNKRRGGGGEKRGAKRKGEERKEGKEDKKVEFLPLKPLFSLPPSPASLSLSPLFSSALPSFLSPSLSMRVLRKVRR